MNPTVTTFHVPAATVPPSTPVNVQVGDNPTYNSKTLPETSLNPQRWYAVQLASLVKEGPADVPLLVREVGHQVPDLIRVN
jgi:hypothetical protein